MQFFTAVVATPGTPQRLTAATTPPLASTTGATYISLQAGPLNTAAKSIYVGGPTMNVAAKTGIGMVLLPGVVQPIHVAQGRFDVGDLWIDTDSVVAANERIYVAVA